MADVAWLKQLKDKPLFENILWSRPENKRLAGRLLIVGGNTNGFKAPATAYSFALKAGIGAINVALPSSLKSKVGHFIEDAIYCQANKSGSFSRQALSELIDRAAWADLTLLSGDFGHNSETSIMIESLAREYKGLLCIVNDSIDSFLINPKNISERDMTLIVILLPKLQKLSQRGKVDKALTSDMELTQFVEYLKELTSHIKPGIITYLHQNIILAIKGQVSTTYAPDLPTDWPLAAATYSSVWWLQNTTQEFAAITSAIYDLTFGNKV